MLDNDWMDWFKGKTFTTDWSSRAFPTWTEHFGHLRKQKLQILEIGSWEGRGSIFFLNFFPRSHVTCMDIYMLGNDPLFDANVMKDYANRVTKIVARSTIALDKLATSQSGPYDIIYVDGSHDRDDVMIDSLLAWRLLREGGIMIWDDYNLIEAMPGHFNQDQDPKPSINVFLDWRKDELEVLHKDYQVIVRKTKAHHPAGLFDPSIEVASEVKARPERKPSLLASWLGRR